MKPNQGFSLIEVAVVLVIVSIALGMVAVPLATQVGQQRVTDTNKQLAVIQEALIGFALANGRLPCAARLVDNGQESVISADNGTCQAYVGFLPAVTLGLSPVDANGFAIDGWGLSQNRIRYAVSTLSVRAGTPASCSSNVDFVFTKTGGMRNATMPCLADSSTLLNMISICGGTPSGAPGAATACPALLTNKAPFVVFSLGSNAAQGGAGIDERHNLDGDSFFVAHARTGNGAPGGEFDDLLAWPSLSAIFAKMVQAGKLP
jgi:prepilin-type N-terminal cleavage/methylation domain-containing protein